MRDSEREGGALVIWEWGYSIFGANSMSEKGFLARCK